MAKKNLKNINRWIGISGFIFWLLVPSAQAGQLAIIIDDLGYNQVLGKRAIDLPGDFTYAILPLTPHGRELAERAHALDKEIMLHAPMSNEQQLPLGNGALVTGMTQEEFLQVLRDNLASIPYLKGVNNHMGSQLTQDTQTMSWLMQELKSHQLYFVDSRTTAKTQALAVAETIGLPSRKRDVFLDNKNDETHIHQQLLLAIKTAQRQGSAIAIGHPYRNTLKVLEKIHPLLEQYQVRLVKTSQLMRKSTSSHQFCSAPPLYLWASTPEKVNPVTVGPIF